MTSKVWGSKGSLLNHLATAFFLGRPGCDVAKKKSVGVWEGLKKKLGSFEFKNYIPKNPWDVMGCQNHLF